jgi:DNA-directed RNA polymerase specialized sigma24 family protein
MNSMVPHPSCLEEIAFSELDSHIRTQVSKTVHHHSWLFPPGTIDMVADDIAQDIRISLWEISHRKQINTPKPYINTMVHHKVADLARRHRPIYPMPLDEYGELYQGDMIISASLDMGDPSHKVEQEEIERGSIGTIIKFILTLPCIQQQAMLCMLKSLSRDFSELEIALQEQGIDISQYDWPGDPAEMQKLKASLFIAKKKLALHLKKGLRKRA